MFVFVIMSHGMRGEYVLDRERQPVDLVKIRDLLSPHHFPAMKGKPKLIIIQACSGGWFTSIFGFWFRCLNLLNAYFSLFDSDRESLKYHYSYL